jgi:hypothetical protein
MDTKMDLMQRLAVSKKIMDKHNEIKRGDSKPNTPIVEDFQPVKGNYNLPEDILMENNQQTTIHDPSKPLEKDRILNSKLPDEIKRLMIEKPIVQPSSINGGVDISEDVIKGAQRLMGMGSNKTIDSPKKQVSENITINAPQSNSNNINIGEIKNMIRDVVRDTVRDVVKEELKQAGMIVESTTNTNETIQFKVGSTLFIGKVTKVKKLEK